MNVIQFVSQWTNIQPKVDSRLSRLAVAWRDYWQLGCCAITWSRLQSLRATRSMTCPKPARDNLRLVTCMGGWPRIVVDRVADNEDWRKRALWRNEPPRNSLLWLVALSSRCWLVCRHTTRFWSPLAAYWNFYSPYINEYESVLFLPWSNMLALESTLSIWK